ncbi:hypothetical protein [Alloyangia pacifica]|uniref:hypothetical protein n=1 Tax=Alloyangia pacifica TaxID=311180 RepID=UPI001CD2A4EA|nr:hypothetical protein [Alloyangia pacifica]MCA0997772.1 hypothetical protein [Alloyangia pacifica]
MEFHLVRPSIEFGSKGREHLETPGRFHEEMKGKGHSFLVRRNCGDQAFEASKITARISVERAKSERQPQACSDPGPTAIKMR